MSIETRMECRRLTAAEALAKYNELPIIDREIMALRASQELEDGMYVNLGIGIPTLMSDWIEDRDLILHSEIGMLKIGPLASPEEVDPDIVDPSFNPTVEVPGCSYFDIAEAFTMIRGGHLDVSVMGAFQVSERGDLCGWNNPSRGLGNIGNVGGSMDLAVGAKKLIITMEHVTNNGELRILKDCTYPLTGKACVNLIVTNLAVIEVTDEGLVLKEIVPGVTVEDVQALTEADLIISPDLKEMEL